MPMFGCLLYGCLYGYRLTLTSAMQVSMSSLLGRPLESPTTTQDSTPSEQYGGRLALEIGI